MRVIAARAGDRWDVRLNGAESIATNRLAPRLVTVYRNDDWQLVLQLMASTPKPPSDAPEPVRPDEDSD